MDVSTFIARRRSLPAEGGEIAYTEFGDAGAPAALFVHGLATGGLMWRHVIEVDGAKLLFPEERPGDLVPHLREFWDR